MSSLTGTQITYITPAPPAQRGSPTSEAAATLIAPTAGTLRAQVLAHLRERGSAGATDEQMQIALAMNPSTQRPRRIELEKLGLVLRTAQTRKTASGRDAVVFIVAEAQL